MHYASEVRNRIKTGMFTGYCYKDRLLQRPRADTLPHLDHPAVDWNEKSIISHGRQRLTHITVVCPKCRQKRHARPNLVAAKIRAGKFTGLCLPCSPNARKREWVTLSPGRKLDPSKGYIRLGKEAIPPHEWHYYQAMRGAQTTVLEHRLVVARTLGRPLTSGELVDHIDGDKTNNDPTNLRIYRRGHNDPGNTCGYGVFYHEWQLALAEVAALRAEVDLLRQSVKP